MANESLEKSDRFILPEVDGEPSKVLSFDEIRNVFKGIDNMQLVHEIALNPSFKLELYNPPENSLEYRLKEAMHKAFWNILREEISSSPPRYEKAVQLLRNIKDYISNILPPTSKRAFELVDELLDETVIIQQANNGVLNLTAYIDFIIDTMSKCCAPARDEKVANLRKITDVVDALRGIMETLVLMKLDMANFILDKARNEILANSIEYEKRKFSQFLEVYKYNFPATESWLRRNQKLDENGIVVSTPQQTINAAYMELVFWDGSHEFPEVLAVDKERFTKLSHQAAVLVVGAALFSLCSGFSVLWEQEEKRQSLTKLSKIVLQATNSEQELSSAVQNIWEQILTLISEDMDKSASLTTESPTVLRFKQQILQLASVDAPVRVLMKQRLAFYVQLRMGSSASTPPPPGFIELKNELELYTATIKRCLSYNHAIFGDFFFQILAKKPTAPLSEEKLSEVLISENDQKATE